MAGIAVPIPPDKAQEWQDWIDECNGPRAEEFDAFNRQFGLTEHKVWKIESPRG